MIVVLAFLAGIAVTAASVFVPHARNPRSSIEEYESFQNILRSLPVSENNKQQQSV